MSAIIVAREFWHRLANRDSSQGDGKHNAREFRQRFLCDLDSPDAWTSKSTISITLDFEGIKKLGPSFANEAFAYFTQYASPEDIRTRIIIQNASRVQNAIIDEELEAGYSNL